MLNLSARLRGVLFLFLILGGPSLVHAETQWLQIAHVQHVVNGRTYICRGSVISRYHILTTYDCVNGNVNDIDISGRKYYAARIDKKASSRQPNSFRTHGLAIIALGNSVDGIAPILGRDPNVRELLHYVDRGIHRAQLVDQLDQEWILTRGIQQQVSGAPLVRDIPNQQSHIIAVHMGSVPDGPGLPQIEAALRVDAFLEWIDAIVTMNHASPQCCKNVDVYLNQRIDIFDFTTLADIYGSTTFAPWPDVDVNCNGRIDIGDMVNVSVAMNGAARFICSK